MKGGERDKTRTVSVLAIRYLVVNGSPLRGIGVKGW
jgi:hypothetical protein